MADAPAPPGPGPMLPCMFCKSELVALAKYALRAPAAFACFVECLECRARGPIKYGAGQEATLAACDAWNGPLARAATSG